MVEKEIKPDKDISSLVWTQRIRMQQLCNKANRLSRFQRTREVHIMLSILNNGTVFLVLNGQAEFQEGLITHNHV